MIANIGIYIDGKRDRRNVELADAFEACADRGGFAWIDLVNPSDEELDLVGAEFSMHPLALEEALRRPHQRPKIESFEDGTVFGVVKSSVYNDVSETITIGEYMFFAGDTFVLCVTHHDPDLFVAMRAALEADSQALTLGPSAVVHALLDQVVSGYARTIEGVENDLDEIENQVFSEVRINATERIFRLKRHVLAFHRAVEPFEAGLDRLSRGRIRGPLSVPEFQSLFDDLHDQLLRVRTREETVRETLGAAFEASIAQTGVRQNEDMRAMAGWAAIIAVPTLFAGIWGMNFEKMPELKWWLGYPLGLLTIIGSGLIVRWRLKRNGWL
jgi:magnesium transporter